MYAANSVAKLKQSFLEYLRVVPVVSYNGGRYYLIVIKDPLIKHLYNTGKIKYTVKKVNTLQCIQTDRFKFVEIICNCLALGYTYPVYLKAFDCGDNKGHFPYEWLTSPDML